MSKANQVKVAVNHDATYSFYLVTKCVVQGIGKRSIVVIIQAPTWIHYDAKALAIEAAKVAARRRWKKVIITQDETYGDMAMLMNLAQFGDRYRNWGYCLGLFDDTNYMEHDEYGSRIIQPQVKQEPHFMEDWECY